MKKEVRKKLSRSVFEVFDEGAASYGLFETEKDAYNYIRSLHSEYMRFAVIKVGVFSVPKPQVKLADVSDKELANFPVKMLCDGEEEFTTTLLEIVKHNPYQDVLDLVEQIYNGAEEVTMGGGAAPYISLRKV